jgi:hypothetical protein
VPAADRRAAPGGRAWPGLSRQRATTDPEGELYFAPAGLAYAWAVLVLLLVLETISDVFAANGPESQVQLWVHDVILVGSAVLIFARAAYEPRGRRAWLAFGTAAAMWAFGDIAWSLAYGGAANPPFPTFADALWLMWYPFTALGIWFLIRVRLSNVELHRWMDGMAVTLMALVLGFAVIVQPVLDHTTKGVLATTVSFAYPILDVLLIGALLGVYGLLGWHPDRMWVLLGAGILCSAIADAASALQQARGIGNDSHYEFIWTLGAVLTAYAAWARVPAPRTEQVRVTGMRAIALPLAVQILAAGMQVYAIFEPVGKSERIVTLAALLVASVQIILSRPRAAPKDERTSAAGGFEGVRDPEPPEVASRAKPPPGVELPSPDRRYGTGELRAPIGGMASET